MKALLVMPSEFYNKISDDDLGAMIAYLKTLPPVDNELDESQLGPVGRILALFEASLIPATLIDHKAPRPTSPPVGVTAEYGEYLAVICSLCHGERLSGGPVPGDEPDAPMSPNITPGGIIGLINEEGFINTLRTGITPGGRSLDSEFMPWQRLGKMTDDELRAIWMYLNSLPTLRFKG